MPTPAQPLNTTPEPEIDPMTEARIFAAGRRWADIMAGGGLATHQQIIAEGFDAAEVTAHWPMIVAHGQSVLDLCHESPAGVRRTPVASHDSPPTPDRIFT